MALGYPSTDETSPVCASVFRSKYRHAMRAAASSSGGGAADDGGGEEQPDHRRASTGTRGSGLAARAGPRTRYASASSTTAFVLSESTRFTSPVAS